MTTVEVLEAARARIERGWCQHAGHVRDASGKPIAWCATTATAGVGCYDDDFGEAADEYIARVITGPSIVQWNDAPGRTQAEVLAAFDKAIALAEAATSRDAAGMK